jgi:hypothetical protein
LKTFKDVTLPLIWKGGLVGSLYSFILALQEASPIRPDYVLESIADLEGLLR